MRNKMASYKNIIIYDTTLRDGEQAPGFSMNTKEKLKMAEQLIHLGVDIIEAGFPLASKGDFEAVKEISKKSDETTIAVLARAIKSDIDYAWSAVKYAKKPRLHIFIPTSDIQIYSQMDSDKETIIQKSIKAVSYAKTLTDDVQFSAMDGTRANRYFLDTLYEKVIHAGATTVNISDTVGYCTPIEMFNLVTYIRNAVKNIDHVKLSIHCHNDLGCATANSLMAIEAGADQVEVTVNGIGERAGNAALEEIIMALEVKKEKFKRFTNINIENISKTSKLLTAITGINVQPNKAVVGKNAFLHQSGIHQDGVLKRRETYELYDPSKIGLTISNITLGKHSGKHGLKNKLISLGIKYDNNKLDMILLELKKLYDTKKILKDSDILKIVKNSQLAFSD